MLLFRSLLSVVLSLMKNFIPSFFFLLSEARKDFFLFTHIFCHFDLLSSNTTYSRDTDDTYILLIFNTSQNLRSQVNVTSSDKMNLLPRQEWLMFSWTFKLRVQSGFDFSHYFVTFKWKLGTNRQFRLQTWSVLDRTVNNLQKIFSKNGPDESPKLELKVSQFLDFRLFTSRLNEKVQ